MENLSDEKKLILLLVDIEIQRILLEGPPSGYGHVPEKRAWADLLQDGLVRTQPSKWYGAPLSRAESKEFSRRCAELEASGYLVRASRGESGRVTHLGLSDLGNVAVERIASEAVNA